MSKSAIADLECGESGIHNHSHRAPCRSLFLFDVFQPDSAPRTQAFARPFNSAQKARVVFKAVFEPIFFRREPNQHPGRLAVARNDDLLRLSFAKITRQIVLDFGQRNFLHAGFANCASHCLASDLATIAKISTVAPDTSQNTRTSPTRSRYCGRRRPRSRLIRLRLTLSGSCRKCVLSAARTSARMFALSLSRSSTA